MSQQLRDVCSPQCLAVPRNANKRGLGSSNECASGTGNDGCDMSSLMGDAQLGHALESKRREVLRLDECIDIWIAIEVEEVSIGDG